MKKIEAERIFLRESTFDDCKFFAEWEQMDSVTEFFTISKGRDYEEVVTEFIKRSEDADKLQLTVCLKEEEKPIGRIYITTRLILREFILPIKLSAERGSAKKPSGRRLRLHLKK